LQREERSAEAAELLMAQLPLPAPSDRGEQRWLWRQLLELAFEWCLQRRGPAAAQELIGRQLEAAGLPADAEELEALAPMLQREGEPRAALLARAQQVALLQGPAARGEGEAQALLAPAQLELVRLLAAEGWIEAAEAHLAPLLADPAAPAAVHQLAGLLAYKLHRSELCASRMEACLAADPADPLAPLFLAKLDLEAERHDGAAARLAALASQPPPPPQQEGQLRQLLWQQGLQTADGTLAALVDVPALLADPQLSDPAGLMRWVGPHLGDAAATGAVHQALAAAQQRLAATLPPLPAPWWEEEALAFGERPLRFALLAREGSGLRLPFGPPEAIAEALAAQGITAQWIDPAGLGSTRAGVVTLRAERWDGVIDLLGWAAGHRQDLLRARVAPLQIGWAGQGLPYGAPWIDALLLDRFLAPAPALMGDAPLLTGGSAFCRGDLPADPAPPRASTDGLVLGVVAPPGCLGRQVLSLWAELLEELPEARLVFVGPGYGQACVQAHLLASLTALGVAPERVGWLASDPAGMAPEALVPLLAERLDVALDPLPAGDPLASLLCLWSGVPVVSATGEALHQRLTAGLLEQLGMASFVAADRDTYLDVACTLASDAGLRANLRQQLRAQLAASLVANVPQFAADLAAALRGFHQQRATQRAASPLPAPWDQELDAAGLEQLLRAVPSPRAPLCSISASRGCGSAFATAARPSAAGTAALASAPTKRAPPACRRWLCCWACGPTSRRWRPPPPCRPCGATTGPWRRPWPALIFTRICPAPRAAPMWPSMPFSPAAASSSPCGSPRIGWRVSCGITAGI
jgi:hypothetical protein